LTIEGMVDRPIAITDTGRSRMIMIVKVSKVVYLMPTKKKKNLLTRAFVVTGRKTGNPPEPFRRCDEYEMGGASCSDIVGSHSKRRVVRDGETVFVRGT
jgi:hypothetical protein